MSALHTCGVCGGPVCAEFGCSHFGFYKEGRHVRHAICCAYLLRHHRRPEGPLLTGIAAERAMAEATT
jgi:hypothetical protein